MAEAMQIPREADLPRPLPAVKLTVDFKLFSDTMSTICMTERAWSAVLQSFTKFPIGLTSFN